MSEAEKKSESLRVLGYAGGGLLARPGEVFRDGPVLIVRDGVRLRQVCVLCGEAGYGLPVRLKFSWDSSFRVAKATTLEMRRAGSVQAWLCRKHWGKWRGGRLVGALGMTASAAIMLGGLAVAMISESSEIPRYVPEAIGGLLAGFAMFIGFLFLFTLRTRTLWCRRIEEGYLYLEGADGRFLAGESELPRGRETTA